MTDTMKASSTKRSWRAPLDQPASNRAVRACDHAGCAAEGEFRAPRSRDHLNEYYWFCLEHVRAYNASWDYYKGMSADEIEAEIRTSTTWQRPTWPMGQKTSNRRFSFAVNDPFGFGLFDEETEESGAARGRPLTPEEQAMKTLELAEPLTLKALRARYKELVKRHHPDANGGDKAAEERFKDISNAYTILLNSLNA
jgi:hypothetical protein